VVERTRRLGGHHRVVATGVRGAGVDEVPYAIRSGLVTSTPVDDGDRGRAPRAPDRLRQLRPALVGGRTTGRRQPLDGGADGADDARSAAGHEHRCGAGAVGERRVADARHRLPVGPWARAVCQALTPLSNDAQAAASTTATASTEAEARTKIIDLYTMVDADVDSAQQMISVFGPPRVGNGPAVQQGLLASFQQLQTGLTRGLGAVSAATTAPALKAAIAGLGNLDAAPAFDATQRLFTAKGTALAAAAHADPTCHALGVDQP